MSHNTDWYLEISNIAECEIQIVEEIVEKHLYEVTDSTYTPSINRLGIWCENQSYNGIDNDRATRMVEEIRSDLGRSVPISVTATFIDMSPSETWEYND